MIRGMSWALVASALFVVVNSGCPAPSGGEGEGEGEGEGAGEGEGEGEGGTAQNGEACHADGDCVSGTCTPFFEGAGAGSFTDFCTASCANDTDCASSGFADSFCLLSQLGGFCFPKCTTSDDCDADLGSGFCATQLDGTNNGCLKPVGTQCEKEADCSGGQHCTAFGGTPFRGFCLDAAQTGQAPGATCDDTGFAAQQAGLVCQTDDDCPGGVAKCVAGAQPGDPSTCQLPQDASCAGFFCFEGQCSGLCNADADCPANNKCEHFNLSQDQTPALQGFCQPFVGSGTPCTKESECSGGEHCGLSTDDTGHTVTVCRGNDTGDVDIGGRCGDDNTTFSTIEPTTGCATNICADNGTCTEVCSADGDCGAGKVCLHFEVDNNQVNPEDELGICLTGTRCDSQADCAAGNVCVPVADFSGVDKVCTPQLSGTLNPGDACTVGAGVELTGVTCFHDADCTAKLAGSVCNLATRTCVPPLDQLCATGCGIDGKCNSTCAADADCGDANELCVGVNQTFDENTADTTDDDEVATSGSCLTVAGSRAACATDGDCATGGEVCQPVPALADGTVSGECAAPVPNGVATGEPCGNLNNTSVAVCAEGLCDIADGATQGTCRPLCGADGDCTAPQTCQTLADAFGPGQDVKVCK